MASTSVNSLEAVGTLLREFIRAEGKRSVLPNADPKPKTQMVRTYEECLRKLSDQECDTLDRIIRELM
jgi:hypothetical protein